MSQLLDCRDPANRADAITSAAAALKSGRLVVMPTDTVYGLAADAFDSGGVAALLAAKGRGRDMPVGVLVGSWTTIEGLVYYVPDAARELIRAFWPGALSLVVQQAPSLRWDLGDARGTVMLRMPLHPVALELLRETGPLAVSSANLTGRESAISAGSRRPTPPRRPSINSAGSSTSTSMAGGRSSRPRRPSSTSPVPLRASCGKDRSAWPRSPRLSGWTPEY